MPLLSKKRIIVATAVSLLLPAVGLLLLIPEKSNNSIAIVDQGCPFLKENEKKADSILAGMNEEGKAAQLIMAAVNTHDNPPEGQQPGGFMISGGSIARLPALVQRLKRHGQVNPLIASGASWGLFHPTDSLGALTEPLGLYISTDSLISRMANNLAIQSLACGMGLVAGLWLSPVNVSYDLPTDRNYAWFIWQLADKLCKSIEIYNRHRLLCMAYGFNTPQPGAWNAGRYDTVRRIPLLKCVKAGLTALYCGNNPESVRRLADSARNTYHFAGLLIAEAAEADEAAAMLRHGADMVVVNDYNEERRAELIRQILKKGPDMKGIETRAKRILMARLWAEKKLNKFNPDTAAICLKRPEAEDIYYRIQENVPVLISNQKETIPLPVLMGGEVLLIRAGKAGDDFLMGLKNFVECRTLSLSSSARTFNAAAMQTQNARTVIFQLTEDEIFADVEFRKRLMDFIQRTQAGHKVVVGVFGSPAFLGLFPRFDAMVWCPPGDGFRVNSVAQAIMGGGVFSGRLPWSVSDQMCRGDGESISEASVFKFTSPGDAGISAECIPHIREIVDDGIRTGAFPGCQIFVARRGKVFLDMAFGKHTYEGGEKVLKTDLYDLASVTKAAATTMALMMLYEDGRLNPDSTLAFYFDNLDENASGRKVRNSDLKKIRVRELLTHCSGLPAGLPVGLFISPARAIDIMRKMREREEIADSSHSGDEALFYEIIDTTLYQARQDSLLRLIFSDKRGGDFTVEVAENFYMNRKMSDSLWQLAKQCKTRAAKAYRYSDLNMYIAMRVAEAVSGKPLDDFLQEKIYLPLGLKRMGFHPLKKFRKEEIIPTEREKYFRKQLIRGYVHDPLAALLGGAGGNAGLFSDARDLAVLFQMLLNGGTYGGIRLFSQATVARFVSAQDGTYRGLGFDRNTRSGSKMIAEGASEQTFGHTGFTGTCVWADPQTGIIFVFLSNRVYPSASNQTINRKAIRQRLQQVVYESVTMK